MPSSLAAAPSVAPGGRTALDVGEIFRRHGEAYRKRHVLSLVQRKALEAIARCRTAALGGHLDVCGQCGLERPSYNSCRNRHCPKCQALSQAQWLERRRERILPTDYFHVVFTLPSALRALCRRHPRQLYDLLFEAASQSLLQMAHRRLGVELGVTAVLHTWTRQLTLHPHLHCVVTGGGLELGSGQWRSVGGRFLLPVRPLGQLFRGKFLDGLRRLHDRGLLDGPPSAHSRRALQQLVQPLYRTDWVVYAKRPFRGAEQVYQYLGRYTHRVGLSNQRLLEVDDHRVRFRTRGTGTATVTPEQFIGRMLLHVLPLRFVKIRHFGLLAPAHVSTRLVAARAALAAQEIARAAVPSAAPMAVATTAAPTWRERVIALTGVDPMRCPNCNAVLHRMALAGPPPALDTS